MKPVPASRTLAGGDEPPVPAEQGSRIAPAPYTVARHLAPTDLRLDGNEGPSPPQDLLSAPPPVELLRCYPDAAPLEAALAGRLGVEPEQVVATAGADDALARILRVVGRPGREILLPAPTFSMLPRYVAQSGAAAVEIPWPAGTFPLAALREARTSRMAALVLVSPNNPTGAAIRRPELEAVLDAAAGRPVVLDQAYGEYADEPLGDLILAQPRGILVGSLSKAWGLAGLRVGYAVAAAGPARDLRAAGQPYAVSALSLALAAAALDRGGAWMHEHVRRIRGERRRLEALLRELGGRPLPSQANFVLCSFDDAGLVFDGLAGLGIAVRRFPDQAGLGQALRITCPGSDRGWERLEHALRTVLAPQALLLPAGLQGSFPSSRSSGRLLRLALPEEAGAEPAPAAAGIKRAWWVCRSAAEVAAARRDGALPVGLLPEEAGGGRREELLAAGAGRVASRLAEIEEWLP